MTTSPTRVAAIGLDAAEWPLLERWIDEGELPNLASLLARSTRAELENVREFRSEAVWSQFASGRAAGTTGHWTNVEFRPDTYEVADVGPGDAPPFWTDVFPAIVFDLPHTRLVDHPGSIHVTGWGSHSTLHPRASYPTGLLREIDERFGPHPAYDRDNTACWHDEDYLEQLTQALEVGARRRVEVVQWLLARQPDWRLLVTVMSEPHSIGHHSWHGIDPEHLLAGTPEAQRALDATRRTYRAVDDAVGRLVASLPDDAAVVVFALHGMQANTNDVPALVLLPELLHRLDHGRGLLSFPDGPRWKAAGMPALPPVTTWGHDLALRFADSTPARVKRAALLRLPPALRRPALAAWSRLRGHRPPVQSFGDIPIPEEATELAGGDWDDLTFQAPSWYRPHWPSMRAFALPTFSDGHVRINLAGREAHGVVAPEDYLATCDRLAEELRACRDPRTGKPAVADVTFPRRHDPHDPMAPPPDLVVFWEPNVDALEHPTAGLIGPVPLMRTGEHSRRGFAMAAGPGIEPTDLGARSALDVTPTLLTLLGAPVHELSGRSLLGALASR